MWWQSDRSQVKTPASAYSQPVNVMWRTCRSSVSVWNCCLLFSITIEICLIFVGSTRSQVRLFHVKKADIPTEWMRMMGIEFVCVCFKQDEEHRLCKCRVHLSHRLRIGITGRSGCPCRRNEPSFVECREYSLWNNLPYLAGA